MYVIGLVIGLIYLIVGVISRKELIPEAEGQEKVSRWLTPFLRMAAWCRRLAGSCRKVSRPKGRCGRRGVTEDMEKLYLGRKVDVLVERYYVEKLALVLVIILAGTVLGVLVSRQARENRLMKERNQITRGDYRQETAKVELEAEVAGYPVQKFSLEVKGYVPGKDQVDALEADFWEEMCKAALGKNISWDEVRSDLCLEKRLDDYPFSVEWTSRNPYLVDDNGTVAKPEAGDNETGEPLELTAVVTYNQWEWTHTIHLTVKPPLLSAEEQLYRELEAYLKLSENESREEAVFMLPGVWQDKEIRWTEEVEDYGIVLWALTLGTGVAIFFLKDKDLHTQVQDRQRRIKYAYPSIVNKLELYLGAGLTIRSAFERIAEDYRQEQAEDGDRQPAYEEILFTCRELRTGTAEAEAYERFGKRCGVQEYIRLGTLLSQNLKKGSTALLMRLREENENAVREQIHRSRQIGEEASTKLLMPMVMILGIVMVVIMVPAFGSM